MATYCSSIASCYYPLTLAERINAMAGQQITDEGTAISFMPGFVQNFSIKAEHRDLFLRHIVPKIFTNLATNGHFQFGRDRRNGRGQ